MKRVTYLLLDATGSVQSRLVQPEEADVSLEPWMLYNINHLGWRLEAWETSESGVQIHGWADWQKVADELASSITDLIFASTQEDLDEETAEALIEKAQAALDGYQVAKMEISVAQVDAVPQREGDDDGTAD